MAAPSALSRLARSQMAAKYWYPGDADAGMIARQQFYMAVRYDGTEAKYSRRNLEQALSGIRAVLKTRRRSLATSLA